MKRRPFLPLRNYSIFLLFFSPSLLQSDNQILIEVRGYYEMSMEDILKVRSFNQQYYKLEEIIFFTKFIVETLYQAKEKCGGVYHSYLCLRNFVVEKKESNKREDDIDPMNKNLKDLLDDNDDLRYKLKDFMYNKYKGSTLELHKKKLFEFRESSNYPDQYYKAMKDGKSELTVHNIHSLDVYSLGVIIVQLMKMEIYNPGEWNREFLENVISEQRNFYQNY